MSKRAVPKKAAPVGLQMLFNALQTANYQHCYGGTSAAYYAAVPKAFLRARETERVETLLKRVADLEYPYAEFGPNEDQRASEHVNVAVISAFWSGVATAWYAIVALGGGNGGTR